MFGKPEDKTPPPLFWVVRRAHVVASLKESWDPSELKGEKILLPGLLVGFSVLAEVLSRRKE